MPSLDARPADAGSAELHVIRGQRAPSGGPVEVLTSAMPLEARIGRIVAVSGAQAILVIERSEPGRAVRLQIGDLVTMHTSFSTVYGIVSALSVPAPAHDQGADEIRIAELELLGEATIAPTGERQPFRRGVSVFPALGDPVYSAQDSDLAEVYAYPDKAAVRIGSLHQNGEVPALISVDDLLGKHFAILGTTGTGKSCAAALILRSILAQHPNGHVLVLDIHNEYAPAIGGMAEVFAPGKLRLPFWLLTFEEIEEIVLGTGSKDREAEANVLNEMILAAKRQYLGDADRSGRVTVDTPVPYRLGDMLRFIDDAAGKLDRPRDAAPYLRLKARVRALQADPRFDFMFGGIAVSDNMAAILSGLFRVPVEGRPVSILDLSGVPSEILNVVISVLCRMVFDFALWSDRAVPIMLVCEEAHRYAPQNPALGFEPTKRALYRIAKEGRKYGVSLCVISQRPSELSVDILSQCNTIYALRMSNQKDQDFVRSTLTESGLGLLNFLPSLRNGEAIAIGEGVPVPMRLHFDDLPPDQRPRSATASFSAGWTADSAGVGSMEAIVERWRSQRRAE